jgi:hypothetical protein
VGLVFVVQTLGLVLFVTLGAPALLQWTWRVASGVPWPLDILCLWPWTYSNVLVWSLLAVPWGLQRTVAAYRQRGWRAALFRLATFAAGLLLVVSYRFAALLIAMVLLWSEWQQRHSIQPSARSWVLVVLTIAASLSPADASLRVRPNGPHFIPAISGLLTGSAGRHDAAGEVAIVGYCEPYFLEPRWVWVW